MKKKAVISKIFQMNKKWKFFDRYLINSELIPYYSTGITFLSFLSKAQLEIYCSVFKIHRTGKSHI